MGLSPNWEPPQPSPSNRGVLLLRVPQNGPGSNGGGRHLSTLQRRHQRTIEEQMRLEVAQLEQEKLLAVEQEDFSRRVHR